MAQFQTHQEFNTTRLHLQSQARLNAHMLCHACTCEIWDFLRTNVSIMKMFLHYYQLSHLALRLAHLTGQPVLIYCVRHSNVFIFVLFYLAQLLCYLNMSIMCTQLSLYSE